MVVGVDGHVVETNTRQRELGNYRATARVWRLSSECVSQGMYSLQVVVPFPSVLTAKVSNITSDFDHLKILWRVFLGVDANRARADGAIRLPVPVVPRRVLLAWTYAGHKDGGRGNV